MDNTQNMYFVRKIGKFRYIGLAMVQHQTNYSYLVKIQTTNREHLDIIVVYAPNRYTDKPIV